MLVKMNSYDHFNALLSILSRLWWPQARCSDVVVAVVFVASLSVFLGWGFVHQKKAMNPVSRTKPLASTTSSDGRQSTDLKDGDLPMPVCCYFQAYANF